MDAFGRQEHTKGVQLFQRCPVSSDSALYCLAELRKHFRVPEPAVVTGRPASFSFRSGSAFVQEVIMAKQIITHFSVVLILFLQESLAQFFSLRVTSFLFQYTKYFQILWQFLHRQKKKVNIYLSPKLI